MFSWWAYLSEEVVIICSPSAHPPERRFITGPKLSKFMKMTWLENGTQTGHCASRKHAYIILTPINPTFNLCFEQKSVKYRNFLSENFHFLVVKFSVYLNRHVFVMGSIILKHFFFRNCKAFRSISPLMLTLRCKRTHQMTLDNLTSMIHKIPRLCKTTKTNIPIWYTCT